jgi:hypothetical protein
LGSGESDLEDPKLKKLLAKKIADEKKKKMAGEKENKSRNKDTDVIDKSVGLSFNPIVEDKSKKQGKQDLLEKLRQLSITFKDTDIKAKMEIIDHLVKDDTNLLAVFGHASELLTLLVDARDKLENEQKKFDSIAHEINERNNLLTAKEQEIKLSNQKLLTTQQKLRDEQGFLRGKSKIEKIQTLLEKIKDQIHIENNLALELVAEGEDLSKYDEFAMQVIRFFGNYSFKVDDAKLCQSWIIQILKYLNLLVDNNPEKSKITRKVERKNAFAVGLLTALHFRFDWIQNSVDSRESRPIELRRIFSALEPTITNLAHLDEQPANIQEYDNAMISYNAFTDDDKLKFIISVFKAEFVEKFNDTMQEELLLRILLRVVIGPEEILKQIRQWENLNNTYLPKFVEYLRIYLTPEQRLSIAQDEIEKLRAKWQKLT